MVLSDNIYLYRIIISDFNQITTELQPTLLNISTSLFHINTNKPWYPIFTSIKTTRIVLLFNFIFILGYSISKQHGIVETQWPFNHKSLFQYLLITTWLQSLQRLDKIPPIINHLMGSYKL